MKWKGKINFELRPQLNGSNIILTEGTGEINAITAKSPLVDNDIVLIEDSAASYAKKKATITNVRPVFGTQYYYDESLAQSTTTSTTPQTKVTLSPTSLPAGTYRVGWYYTWAYTTTNSDFRGQVTVGGTAYAQHREEPQDAGTDQYHMASGFFNIDLSGDQTILLQYFSSGGGSTSYIRDARLEFWRIS